MVSVKEVIIVEGRYDKISLEQVVDAVIFCTDGFQIFKDKEKRALFCTLARQRGLIILTDSDGAGQRIRGYLNGIVDKKLMKNAYIPDVAGRERRKSSPSKEGKLGVEGMPPEILLQALRRSGATIEEEASQRKGDITKTDLYRLGLSGGTDSAQRRKSLQRRLNLPERLSANQLLDVLNVITTKSDLGELVELIQQESQTDGAQRQNPSGGLQEQHR